MSINKLKNEWVWDILGVLLGLIILIAGFAVWKTFFYDNCKQSGNPVITNPSEGSNKPFLLTEVDGRQKLLGEGYTYYIEDVAENTAGKINTVYQLAVQAVFEYLAGEGGISSSYLVAQQDTFKTLDIYVYSEIYDGVNKQLDYQGMLIDWKQYLGGIVLMVNANAFSENSTVSDGELFYQFICQCLHLLSYQYNNEAETAIYGLRNYDSAVDSAYGQAIDEGMTRLIAGRIYTAYSYYLLDAPEITTQAPYTALCQIAEQLESILGSEMVDWYIKNEATNVASAFVKAISDEQIKYNDAYNLAQSIASAATQATGNPHQAEIKIIPILSAVDKWKYFCELLDPFDYAISGKAPNDAATRYSEAMEILDYLQPLQ